MACNIRIVEETVHDAAALAAEVPCVLVFS